MTGDACCAPSAGRTGGEASPPFVAQGAAHDLATMVLIPAGEFVMGCDEDEGYLGDGESPSRWVELDAFRMDTTAVTNAQFARFVDDSAYVTEAERFGWSYVFAGFLPQDFPQTASVDGAEWWRQVEGAYWRQPEGPHARLDGRWDHPAVHVSWNDASVFAAWAGKRLPTEAEWEKAARGGLPQMTYPWGDEFTPGGVHRCNTWQGMFPIINSRDDGYSGTAPVATYEPNGYGLYNMVGNTWEWCADYFDKDIGLRQDFTNPRGPSFGTHKVIRGGSYLCHDSYCFRYRVSARSLNTPDSSTGNMGFRCAGDVSPHNP